MDIGVIIGLLGGLCGIGGLIVSAYTAKSSAHKTEVETMQMILTSLQEECKRLTEENRVLEKKVDLLTTERDTLRKEFDELSQYVYVLGYDPVKKRKRTNGKEKGN